jgi:Zn-dependent peptidase ImmA (M78 family)
VNVFDLSQTEGKEVPTPSEKMIEGGGDQEKALLQEWTQKIEIPIIFKDTGEANGYFHLTENYIAIYESRSTTQQLKTLIHEYSHSLLHAKGAKFEKEKTNIREKRYQVV